MTRQDDEAPQEHLGEVEALRPGELPASSQVDLLAALRALPASASPSPPLGLRALALVEGRGEETAWGLAAFYGLGAVGAALAAGQLEAGSLGLGLPCLLLVVVPGLLGAAAGALFARLGQVATSRGLLVLLSVTPALLASQFGCPMDGWLHALGFHLLASLILGLGLRQLGRRPSPA